MGEGKVFAEAMLKNGTQEKLDAMLGECPSDDDSGISVSIGSGDNNLVNNGSIVINSAEKESNVERNPSHNRRSTDEYISVAQAAQLKDMVVKIEAMEAQRVNGKQAKAIWTGLSDHCNVPHSKSATPRYQLICENQFHQAMNYLLTWKNQLLKQQLVELEKAQITHAVDEKHWLEKLASLIVGK